jgi:hypothetical protein
MKLIEVVDKDLVEQGILPSQQQDKSVDMSTSAHM